MDFPAPKPAVALRFDPELVEVLAAEAASVAPDQPRELRVLKMTFEVHAEATGDQLLSPLVGQAMKALSCGPQLVGRSCRVDGGEGAFALITLAAFQQTPD